MASFLDLDGLKTFKQQCDNKYLSGLKNNTSLRRIYVSTASMPKWSDLFPENAGDPKSEIPSFAVVRNNSSNHDGAFPAWSTGVIARLYDTASGMAVYYGEPIVQFFGGAIAADQSNSPSQSFGITCPNNTIVDLHAIPAGDINAMF